MRIYEDKIYTSKEKREDEEYIFPASREVGLVIPKENYYICYDVTSANRVTTTLKITWDDTDELYLIVQSIKDDKVLDKYNLNAGYAYFILHFVNDELVDFGGIEQNTFETYYFEKKDFEHKLPDKPRILQAPIIALYAPGLYTEGMQELGYQSKYMINSLGEDEHFLERKPDYDLELRGSTTEVCRARTLEFMYYALKNFDIMHFHSNWSLLLGGDRLWLSNADMGYIKKMGKKIVLSSWGLCDQTIGDEYRDWKWFSECSICTKLRPYICENAKHCEKIKISRKYSDLILTNGRGALTDKKIIWMDNPIDVNKYSPQIRNDIPKEFKLPNTDKLRVYHSFGNMEKREDLKGSHIVQGVIERLQGEGYAIELMFFNKTKHSDLKYYQVQADIVIDQLYAGWHGSTGVECMALGKAMITYINPDVEHYVRTELNRDIPFLSATPESLYDVLKELIENTEERQNLGKRARDYAIKYHDYRVVVKQLSKLYDEIYTE